jgi:hypothetical protein
VQRAVGQQLVDRVGERLPEQVADRVGEVEQVEVDRLGESQKTRHCGLVSSMSSAVCKSWQCFPITVVAGSKC